MNEDWVFKRGDLYYANLNPYFGSEQGGTRPVLVLQNNMGNFFCPTLIVAPLTSKWIKKKELPVHIGKVSREEMRAVDEALQVSLDIHIPEEMEAP